MGNEVTLPPTEPLEPTPGPTEPGRVRARLEVDPDLVQGICKTSGFDTDGYLVVRRASEFPVTLHSTSELQVGEAVLVDSHDQRNSVKLGHAEQPARSTASGMEIHLTLPADLPVGEYRLELAGTSGDGGTFKVSLERKVVVFFNAWSSSDAVFMENSAWREEYVLNSDGRVYAGSVYGMPWSLALYRQSTLEAVLLLLRKAPLTFQQRRSAVLVSREMSALVNVQDDRGVVVGNWSGDYEGGTAPSSWRGSGKILSEYLEGGGQPVRFGQCWVFSGVLLTVLRVLGVPSRSVTNFSSAHDTNRNRTIDEYYTEDGEKIGYLSSGSDSVWNFHVWNEGWMSRPDLPPGFGGWQVLDATPQEQSPQGGGYRAGPAPVKAVKEGNSVVFDTNFVIAEVNADIKRYVVGKDGVPQLKSVSTDSVGKDISTKSVGSWRREDVTHTYKHPEGSKLERTALYHGYEELLKQSHDVTFTIPKTTFKFGEDAVLKVEMSNKARKHHLVKGTILCQAVDYTGTVLRDEVEKLKVDTKVVKGKNETVTMTIGGSIFSEFPGNKVYLKFTVYLTVHGTSQVFAESKSMAPELPELKIVAPARLALGATAQATATFTNPLSVAMENIVLTLEGDGLITDEIELVVGSIEAGGGFAYPFSISGLVVGKQQLVGGLSSSQVELVSGEAEVIVVEGREETDSPAVPDVIRVTSVDSNLTTNHRVHHTDGFDLGSLILRRGQLFSLTLQLATPIPSNTSLVTKAIFTLLGYNNQQHKSFEVATVSTTMESKLTVELRTPSNAEIGRYKVLLKVGVGDKVTVVDQSLNAVLLFNPWHSEDRCYYPETGELSEYVLNQSGRIWVGSDDNNYGRPWQFAQFTRQALQVSLQLLDRLPVRDRADPVKVSRHLSAMVNVQDDNGILVGNWSGNYSGGASPLSWTGSAEILDQFMKTRKPVRYAQCWVFSGVQTSLLRCVGLPGRSISNFNSAHDTENNRAIDRFISEDGEVINRGDSIWNFHVWNEGWMSRPDLPPGFGGWQVLDATPQEQSPQGGGFRLGPCPVRAVKLGQRVNYDVEFVISEVNADIRSYVVRRNGEKVLTRVDTTQVGKNISTKAVGSSRVNIVTNDYKFPEGSKSERATLLASETQKEVGVEVSVGNGVLIGQSFTVVVSVTNKTKESHQYSVRVRGRAMLYTGITGQVVRNHSENINLRHGQTGQVKVAVQANDYLKLLEGGNFIHFVAMVIADNDVAAVATHNLRLKTPDISISLPEGGLKLYRPATITVSFTNPLNKTLYNGQFQLLGESHVQPASATILSVPPRSLATATMTTIPVKAGPVELVVRFKSDKLSDIMGDLDTTIAETS